MAEGSATGADYVGGLIGQNTVGVVDASVSSGAAWGNEYVG